MDERRGDGNVSLHGSVCSSLSLSLSSFFFPILLFQVLVSLTRIIRVPIQSSPSQSRHLGILKGRNQLFFPMIYERGMMNIRQEMLAHRLLELTAEASHFSLSIESPFISTSFQRQSDEYTTARKKKLIREGPRGTWTSSRRITFKRPDNPAATFTPPGPIFRVSLLALFLIKCYY
jgi:hypothetical protein